jgi:hypothetical protein
MGKDIRSPSQTVSAQKTATQTLDVKYSIDKSYGFVPSSLLPTLHDLEMKTQLQIDVTCCRDGRTYFKIFSVLVVFSFYKKTNMKERQELSFCPRNVSQSNVNSFSKTYLMQLLEDKFPCSFSCAIKFS